ncbi:hypothetical protein JCM10213_003219 [Rhodosporidiobolus nylandii]
MSTLDPEVEAVFEAEERAQEQAYVPFFNACRAVFFRLYPRGWDSATPEQQQAWWRWQYTMEEAVPRWRYLMMTDAERRGVNDEVSSLSVRAHPIFTHFAQAPIPGPVNERLFPVVDAMQRKYPRPSFGSEEEEEGEEGEEEPLSRPGGSAVPSRRQAKMAENRATYWSNPKVRRAFLEGLVLYPTDPEHPNSKIYNVPKLDNDGRPMKDAQGHPRMVRASAFGAVQNYIHRTELMLIPRRLLTNRARGDEIQAQVAALKQEMRAAPQPSVYDPQTRNHIAPTTQLLVCLVI